MVCAPCDSCYPQDQPFFDPTKSSTYVELPCDSSPCQALPRYTNGNTSGECKYHYSYADNSYTAGVLFSNTFTFGSTEGQVFAFPNSLFGCGHDNSGTFNILGYGLVGLGGGSLSLISQLGAEIEYEFSYCLLPWIVNTSSVLRFGPDAIISGREVVSTPLVSTGGSDSDTFYYLTLDAVSVGSMKIPSNQIEGNIIIDSGSTLTMLNSDFYDEIEVAVTESISLDPVQDPPDNYRLCYNSDSFSTILIPRNFSMGITHHLALPMWCEGRKVNRLNSKKKKKKKKACPFFSFQILKTLKFKTQLSISISFPL
ncbi:unnamed protein product [Ilex paraguariensis]|uniref:Peptidase A1 domain-containing protein n=1 Tax=Ilex paraguariensis TaxID=185542 RepID=A0ABC8RWZ7_9AQUA